ncbi:MAG: hypothetical protein HRT45_10240 [Bdellovibrionales bacterium]|nr:hypothetical protein [Bdellovibrionales bacterium]
MITGAFEAVGTANFNPEHFFVDLQLDKTNPEISRNQDSTDVFFAHEMGHFDFEKRLAEQYPLIAQKHSVVLELGPLFEDVIQVMSPFWSDPSCETTGSDCHSQMLEFVQTDLLYATYISYNESKRNFFEANQVELERIESAALRYEELYADLFAAVFYENSEIILTALRRVYPEAELDCRSFTKQMPKSFIAETEHCELSLARPAIWQLVDLASQQKNKPA